MPAPLRLSLCLVFALGCRPPTPSPKIGERDDLGRVVALEGPPKRVLSLAPSHTEFAFALGAGEQLIGRTASCDHPPEALQVPAIGNLFPPDYERLVAARPDLVLMLDGSVEVRRRLEGLGLKTFVLQPRTVGEVVEGARRLGRLLGRSEEGVALARGLQQRLDAVAQRLPAARPRVFYEVWPEPLTSAGPASFIGDLLRLAGAQNAVVQPDAEWPQVPVEAMIAANPEVFVTPHAATLEAFTAGRRVAWQATSALKTKRVVRVLDSGLISRPGPRIAEAVEWMARALHPRAFE